MPYYDWKEGSSRVDDRNLFHQIKVESEVSVVRDSIDDVPVPGATVTASNGKHSSHKKSPKLRYTPRLSDPRHPDGDSDRQGMSDLVHFLKHKEPPPSNWISHDSPPEAKSSLFKSFRRRDSKHRNKAKGATTEKLLQLPDTAVAQKTINGHWHIAISIPKEHDYREKYSLDTERPRQNNGAPLIPDFDLGQIERSPPSLKLDMGFRPRATDADEANWGLGPQREETQPKRAPTPKQTPRTRSFERLDPLVDPLPMASTRTLDTQGTIGRSREFPLDAPKVREPRVNRRRSYNGFGSQGPSAALRSPFDPHSYRASYPTPPRCSSKQVVGQSPHIAGLLRDFSSAISRDNSELWSGRSAKNKRSDQTLKSRKSETDSIYELSQATLADAEIARGYCAYPSPSNGKVKTYRPAGPILYRKLSDLSELSHEGLARNPSGSTLDGDDRNNAPLTMRSEKRFQRAVKAETAPEYPQGLQQPRKRSKSRRRDQESRPGKETEKSESTTTIIKVGDNQSLNVTHTSEGNILPDDRFAFGPPLRSPLRPRVGADIVTSGIMLVAAIPPEQPPAEKDMECQHRPEHFFQPGPRKASTATISSAEDAVMSPSTHTDKSSSVTTPSIKTRRSSRTSTVDMDHIDASAADSDTSTPSLSERRAARRMKRNVLLKQQALEARLRKVETQNAVLVTTLNAVAEMGVTFREMLKQHPMSTASKKEVKLTKDVAATVNEGLNELEMYVKALQTMKK